MLEGKVIVRWDGTISAKKRSPRWVFGMSIEIMIPPAAARYLEWSIIDRACLSGDV